MHIILTHEQADFDALASLLGAYLLLERAIPVLPRRMNRNLRAFLALYGAELPFVDPRDLPNQPIERVTLVDTQSMVSLKGMSQETRIDVIDHHPVRESLPENWSVTTQEIGATATLLVEALQEHNGALSPIYATLMLLGIYEDTGSLTYSRSTARDLRAAAILLEQGASLTIAGDFLNQPLSDAQQVLYDRLRASAEHVHIHGYTIIVATGHAQEMDEELSSVAHKLRDLMDPDAIFLLVTTRGGVQLIARSSTDNIDVAELAANFGGGGHERAAAGLIRGLDLESVRTELIRLLPEYVRPAVTVAQIMSSGPQVLSPETPVQEAARRMRRYGYEGYPVVEAGKVVGLLTRRAVDRATAHKLDYSVDRLMEKGEFSVNPNDSIEHLQRLVSETGWGQIPVVDPDSGDVIGIVTRTDLLKNLASGPTPPGRLNLASKLESALAKDRLDLLKTIAQVAHDQHAALYVVGGFVRDLLLERPSPDFDLVVEGDAIRLARGLAMRYGGRVTGHARFGTAKWHLDNPGEDGRKSLLSVEGLQTVDLVTARTEFYTHPTALPTVERGSIKLDLHRRDFTINTLALRLDGRHYGELHDYWGGLNDLRAGLVRVLHSLSFVDDPTRILRAVRFEQRFAFRIEERTMELLVEARPLIDRLSGDRLRHELNNILESTFAPQIMSRLHSLDLIRAIHSDLEWDDWLFNRIESLDGIVPDREWGISAQGRLLKRDLAYTIWMIQLQPGQADGIVRRLKIPVKLAEGICSACALWQDRLNLKGSLPSEVVKRLDEAPELSCYAVYLATSDVELREALWNYVHEWQKIQPGIDGHTLRSLGIPPGPIYRDILTRLRGAWLDGLVTNQDEEQAFVQELLAAIEV
jgi:tRNA nucleotidyltransferase (CCA-adding enzyme)